MMRRRSFLALTVAAAASPVLGGSFALAAGDTVVVGSKNFPEQLILGEMYGQLLENAGLKVERKLNLGGTAVAHEALKSGDIDLYPEYTGTGLLAVLDLPIPAATAGTPSAGATPVAGTIDQQVYDIVKQAYQQFNLVWLDESPFNNTQALAVRRSFAEEKGITTISQMVAMASDLTLAAVPDFEEREDGLVGLKKVYGDFSFKKIDVFDPGVKYQSFLDGDAQVVLAFGTDGEIKGYDLVVLQDDKGLWPPYHVAPVVRQDALDAHPDIATALNALAPLLTDEVMSGLNWKVVGDEKLEPAAVAKQFLQDNGLLPAS